MVSMTHILCPVDFSEFSRRALECAVSIARCYGARVTALHVIPTIVAFGPPTGEGLYPPMVFSPEDLRQFRDELAAFARGCGAADVETEVAEGSVSGVIEEFARDLPADLVVMGTHGRSGFERLLLGSVTEKILRKAPCPVLTVPAQNTAAAPVPLTRVLCAIDFSPASRRALTLAQSLAGESGAKLCVMHVLEPVSVFEPVASGGPAASADVRREARYRLERLIDSDTRAFTDVVEVVVAGKPYQEILRVAGEQHADLIVIGAHGGARGLPAFGSTTSHIVRTAQCPVLTVRG